MNGLLGYQFGPNQKLEIDYRYYRDKRGNGVKVYVKDGGYETFIDHNLRASYEGSIKRVEVNANAFYFYEQYYRQNENINNSGEYKLVDKNTIEIMHCMHNFIDNEN